MPPRPSWAQGEITVSTGRVGDDAVRVSVADTGQGISAEGLSHLFEPFYTTKPPGGAPGWASPCRGRSSSAIAQADRVSSELDKGTVFTLTLPIDPRPDGAARHPDAAVWAGTGSGAGLGPRCPERCFPD